MTPSDTTPFPTPSPPPFSPDTPSPATPVARDDAGLPTEAQAQELLSRVVQTAHEAIDRLADTAAPHVDRLQRGWVEANQQLHVKADQARQVGDHWTEATRVKVRASPLTAVASAFAFGYLIARLMR